MNVPVAWGSRAVTTFDVDSLHFISMSFPSALTLPPHAHDRPTVAVVTRGGFATTLAGDEHACTVSSLRVEPAGSVHTNRFGASGAHVVVVQPDPASTLFDPARDALSRPDHRRDVRADLLARAIARELHTLDGVSPMALQGLALELVSLVARSRAPGTTPRWLTQATELLHDRVLDSLSLQAIADAVGVGPAELASAFRAHHGESIGAYARRLRLEWVASRLRDSSESIASLAQDAGFADQPHLTRAFRAFSGLTPARYRRLARA